jgi:hypothetical protein
MKKLVLSCVISAAFAFGGVGCAAAPDDGSVETDTRPLLRAHTSEHGDFVVSTKIFTDGTRETLLADRAGQLVAKIRRVQSMRKTIEIPADLRAEIPADAKLPTTFHGMEITLAGGGPEMAPIYFGMKTLEPEQIADWNAHVAEMVRDELARRDPMRLQKANGCGSTGTEWIPDGWWGAACDKHDVCYETCGRSKFSCDVEFYGNLRSSWCPTPRLYFMGVVVGGGKAYKDAQAHCTSALLVTTGVVDDSPTVTTNTSTVQYDPRTQEAGFWPNYYGEAASQGIDPNTLQPVGAAY